MADQSVATTDDILRLERVMRAGFASMNEQFKSVDEKFKLACQDSDRILDVLVSVDQRLTTKTKDHERRIRILEKAMAA